MKKLILTILTIGLIALGLGLEAPPAQAGGWTKYVVFDSLDVSAQTGDIAVEVKGYGGRGALIGGLLSYTDYTYTTTAGLLEFYVTDGVGPEAHRIIEWPVEMVLNGTLESDDDYDFNVAATKVLSPSMSPNLAGNFADYYVYGDKFWVLYDHNGGDTGYITLIFYIRNE